MSVVTLLTQTTANPGSSSVQSPAQGSDNAMPFAVFLTLDITALTGTSVALQVQMLDPVSGKWINYGAAFTAVTSTGTSVYVVGSTGIGAAAGGVTGVLNYPAPPQWRVQLTFVAVTNVTYTLSGQVLALNN